MSEHQPHIKVRIRRGNNEIEYEGPSALFGDSDLMSVVEKFAKQIVRSPDSVVSSESSPLTAQNEESAVAGEDLGRVSPENLLSVLPHERQWEVVKLIGIHIVYVQGKQVFERKDVIKVGRSAPTLWTSGLRSNLTKIFRRLTRDKVFLKRDRFSYSLHADCRKEMDSDEEFQKFLASVSQTESDPNR